MIGNNSKVGITRKEFVKKAVVGVAAVGAVAIGKSGMARAQGTPQTWHVYPDNVVPSLVIKNTIAQAADGDIIEIHSGTYNLGSGTILITKSLKLLGNDDGTGIKPKITSTGTSAALPSCVRVDAPRKDVSLTNLHVDQAYLPRDGNGNPIPPSLTTTGRPAFDIIWNSGLDCAKSVTLENCKFTTYKLHQNSVGVYVHNENNAVPPNQLDFTMNSCESSATAAVVIQSCNIKASLANNTLRGWYGLFCRDTRYPPIPPFVGSTGSLTAYNTDITVDGFHNFGIPALPVVSACVGVSFFLSTLEVYLNKTRIHLVDPLNTPSGFIHRFAITCGPSVLYNQTKIVFPALTVPIVENKHLNDVTIDSPSSLQLTGVIHAFASGCTFTDIKLEGPVSAKVGIDLAWASAPTIYRVKPNPSNNLVFSGINFSSLTAEYAQVYMESETNNNYFGPGTDPNTGQSYSGNVFGHVLSPNGIAGVWCEGDTNTFQDNDFRQSGLLGWEMPDHTAGIGCVYLGASSNDNLVNESGAFPPGTGGAYHQCWDEGTNNRVVGLPANKMTSNPGIGVAIRDKIDTITQQAQGAPAEMSAYGYVWDGQKWVCPEGYHVDENGYCVQD